MQVPIALKGVRFNIQYGARGSHFCKNDTSTAKNDKIVIFIIGF